MVGTVQDITELKMVEQALEDSEALYHYLVEHLPMSVFRKDREGRFTPPMRAFAPRSADR